MNDFFSTEGPVIGFLEKVGYLIILSILWLVCSLPIITIGASTTALYYSVVKAVRRDVGYPVKEFFRAFRKNLIRASLITILFILVAAVSLLCIKYLIYKILILLLAMMGMYIFPVLSRFEMKLIDIIKLSFVMSINFWYITIVLLLSVAVMILLLYKILPVWVLVILPAGYAYLSSYLVEKAMKKYIKVTDDNKDEWYIF